MLGPAVQARRALHPAGIKIGIKVKPELGGDHHLATEGSERFTYEFFVQEWPINFGGVEKGYAAFNGCLQKRSHLLLIFGWAVGEAHSHAAETDRRDFQIAVSKFSLFHFQVKGWREFRPGWCVVARGFARAVAILLKIAD
jgi:hypothetical protein